MTAAKDSSVPFLTAVIEHLADPVFVKNRDFLFVLVNRAFCEMTGYGREEMLGKTDYDFFAKSEADFFRLKDEEMFAAGATVTIEEEPITDAAGRTHILATTKVPITDDRGEVSHLVGIIHDITATKEAEQALRDAKEDLEQRVAERTAELVTAQQKLLRQERLSVLGELVGGLAHQLRNPLGAIQNAATVVRRVEREAQRQQALDIIQEEVGRADLTIRALLDYARVRPPDRCELVLGELIQAALEAQPIPSSVAVAVEQEGEIVAAIDPLQLQTALGNILQNTVEAMPNGGRLSVASRRNGAKVLITVQDDGPGVDEGIRDNLFDPLVTTKPEGSGLGLSTARNVIENHGGTLRYAPAPGGGARFTVELPDEPSETNAAAGILRSVDL